MRVCIVSSEYAFEYPLGDFCYPFRLLAQELVKRNHEVTVLCLGPELDIIHHGVRLRAVGLGHKEGHLRNFGPSLQVWEYLTIARDTLLRELTTISTAQPFDVVEASAEVLGKQLLDQPSGFVLRLIDADLPRGACSTERDLNLRLIRIKQSQAMTIADAAIADQAQSVRQDAHSRFAGDPMMEHLSFDIPSCPPPPLLPRNSSKSVFVAQWFRVIEARDETLELIVQLAKNTNDFRIVIPCDCTAAEPNEQHQKDVSSAREKLSREMGSSARLWIVHNLKVADLATCLSGSEALFVPSKAGIGFQFLGGFYGIPTVEACQNLAARPSDWATTVADKIASILSNQSAMDSTLSAEVHAALATLVESREKSYQSSLSHSHQNLRHQFVDDVDELVLDMDRLAGNLGGHPSLTDKIKSKVRRVLTSAVGGPK